MHGRAGGAGGSTSGVGGTRYASRLTPAGPVIVDPNIGGRIQIKLGFEAGTLQLIVTIVCAAGLTLRANGAARNPYVKVSSISVSIDLLHQRTFCVLIPAILFSLQIFLLPDRCDKSKRRSKTLASTNDPRWGQTFVYSGLRRADLNNKYLEVIERYIFSAGELFF